MANYGHDPTETAVPYHEFKEAGFEVDFVTEKGNVPECDKKMLEGWTQKLLGASMEAVQLYQAMKTDLQSITPLSWSSEDFTLEPYDLVFLPGGHEKGVVQVINSPVVHRLLADYFPKTRKPSKKSCAAICHGVMCLSETTLPGGKSAIHDATTTALPGMMEQGIFWATRAVLGDYYKTYGASSESVEVSVSAARICIVVKDTDPSQVTKRLDNAKQFHSSLGSKP